MTDYISREAVSLVLGEFGDKAAFAYTDLIRAMAKIPIADVVERELYQRALSDVVRLSVERPEQKHGKWMPICDGNEFGEVYQIGVYCSECDEELQSEPNFCPNCGARMDGER